MTKGYHIYLEHILESIEKVQNYTHNLDEESFLANDLVKDGVIRNIEIMGEAVKNLPEEFKDKHPEVPWRDITGMRDRIIHAYFGIDYKLVWLTIQKDLPELENQIRQLM